MICGGAEARMLAEQLQITSCCATWFLTGAGTPALDDLPKTVILMLLPSQFCTYTVAQRNFLCYIPNTCILYYVFFCPASVTNIFFILQLLEFCSDLFC